MWSKPVGFGNAGAVELRRLWPDAEARVARLLEERAAAAPPPPDAKTKALYEACGGRVGLLDLLLETRAQLGGVDQGVHWPGHAPILPDT